MDLVRESSDKGVHWFPIISRVFGPEWKVFPFPGLRSGAENVFKGFFEKGPNSFVGITGKTISSTEIEIEGVVSKNNPFTYNLDEGTSLEVIDGSVRTELINLSNEDIDLEIEEQEVVITTDYSEEDLEDEYFLNILSCIK